MVNCFYSQPSYPRKTKDRLSYGTPGEETTYSKTDHGNYRDKSVLEGMAIDHNTFP
jgi:hypothetical protein